MRKIYEITTPNISPHHISKYSLVILMQSSITGAVVSNFLQNGIVATIVVANIYVQVARGFSSFEAGLLTIGHIITLLVMIRIGERMLQKMGARKPMLWSILIAALGMSMAAMTFLPDAAYVVVVFVGFLIAGIGVGMYATPSMDTSLVHINNDQVGIASGIYKMASSLGNSFCIAISTAIYGTVQLMTDNIHVAGAMGILKAFVFGILSFWVVQKTISPEEGLSDSFEVVG